MHETRHQFREALKELEQQTLGGLDLVIQQLDRALESISYQDVELAAMVVADDDRIDGRYLEVHQGILSLLARQAPVAGDLRIVAALLHIIRCVERMGDQCVNIAKLVPALRLRGAQGQGHPRRDRADGPAGPLAGLAGQGGVRARATSSWPRTSSARTPRSTGSTARSSGARSRWATTSRCASGRCS